MSAVLSDTERRIAPVLYRWAPAYSVVLVLTLGLLGATESYWLDEAISAYFAKKALPELLTAVRTQVINMGLHYTLLHFWMMFGQSELWARSLSAVCIAGAVPAIFGIARRLHGPALAVLAVTLVAFNPFVQQYAQEVRGYGLVLLLTAWSTWALLRYTEHGRLGFGFLYAVLAAASVYAHLMASLFVVAQVAMALSLERRHIRRMHSGILAGVFTLLTAPIALFCEQSGETQWVPPVSLLGLWYEFRAFSGGLLGRLLIDMDRPDLRFYLHRLP